MRGPCEVPPSTSENDDFLQELSWLQAHSRSVAALQRSEADALRSHCVRLGAMCLSTSKVSPLLVSSCIQEGGGPSHQPVHELACCVAVILRRARGTSREVSVVCSVLQYLRVFLSYFPLAAMLLLTPSSAIQGHESGDLPEPPHEQGGSRAPLREAALQWGEKLHESLLGIVIAAAEDLLERNCNAASAEDSHEDVSESPTQLQQQPSRLLQRTGKEARTEGPPLLQPFQDGSQKSLAEVQDSFQQPRPLKRRAQGVAPLETVPTARVGGTALSATRQETGGFAESGGLTVALGRQAAAAGYHALALKAEQLQLRQRWIAGISDDSILTSKSKSTTNPTGATERAAGIAVVGCVLRALATRLDESWPLRDLLRPPLKDVASPRGPPFAESPKAFADALKGYLGKAALGSHKGAHGESRIKDFLTMEARGGMCDQRLAEGDFAHSERLPFPYRLRLWTLDLVYAVRHLCTHFSRDHSPTRSCDSSGGPGGPPSTKQGGPRERAGPPPGDRLRGTAAWLLSSEAMEALGGAPLWLFGLPATSESALFKEEAASRRSDGWVTVAEALQAAAVRAFAAGGGPFPPPMEDPLLTRASAESDGALYPFYTPLQNCIRLLWHCTDSAGAHAPSESPLRGVYGLLPPADCISNGGGDALWRGGPEALSASFSEDEESQLAFECHRELLQQGVEPPFSRLLGASLSTLRSIYGSEEDGEAPRPLDPQRKAQSSARQGPSGPQPLVAQHLKQQQQRRLLQHHIAEDCLDILSRGWAPSDSLSGRASLRSREDSGGPLAVGYPPLTASSLGPTMPLLVCSLEQMLASWGRNSGEDASQGVPLPPELCISALFAEGKLRAAAERGR
ncbi:hypothetical protein cyc_00461 [Cyclospora cayetanensis]|uniref:Uncharacterized protein n=1 Tax=Cyclospora cayetanensis TaxID=88456 RepID=A0A1D3CUU1_9EIME|nr:hypothetical protein cyc_00461 [Cyclospora cayetanensis]